MYYVIRDKRQDKVYLDDSGFFRPFEEVLAESEDLEYLRTYCAEHHPEFYDLVAGEHGNH